MSSRLLTIAPVPSTANLHHLRIHLLPHPPSSRVSLAFPPLRALPTRTSSSSSPLSSLVVHEPPRALNLSPQLNIRAFAS